MKCKAILIFGMLMVVSLVNADLASDLEALGGDMPKEEKPDGFIGEGGISMEWNINKTGAEESLEVTYTIINKTTTEFCIFVKKMELYSTTLSLSDKDIRAIPIEKLGLTNSFDVKKTAIDLSKAEDEKTRQCFDVNYEKEIEGLTFKIGWDSVVVDSTADSYATAYATNENIVKDSNGNLFVIYKDQLYDLKFANSSDDGATWSTQVLYAGSIRHPGIVIDTNDKIYVFFFNDGDGDDFDLFDSTDGGKTWSNKYSGESSSVSKPFSCIPDSNNIIHCCFPKTNLFDRTLSYLNSTNWENPVRITTDENDDVEYCDIAVDTNNNVYIVGVGQDHDDLDIFASHDSWTRRQIDNSLGVAGTGYAPSITITPDNEIYISTIDNTDLQFYNSTTSQFTTTWTQKEVDSSSSYFPDISYTSDGDIYILYQSSTGQTSIYRANSSDKGKTWDKRILLHSGLYRDASTAHTLFPESNRITDTFRYVYTKDSSNDVYFNSFSVTYTPPITNVAPIIIANATSPTIIYTNTDFKFNMTATDNDNTTLNAYVEFYVNGTSTSNSGIVITNNTNTQIGYLDSINFDEGDVLIAEFWVSDNINTTIKQNTTGVTVQAILNTCTCPASGNWNIQCSDNCDIQACDMQTNNVLLNGTGNILSLRNITNATRIRMQGGCIVRW